jgi:hypothetical protein
MDFYHESHLALDLGGDRYPQHRLVLVSSQLGGAVVHVHLHDRLDIETEQSGAHGQFERRILQVDLENLKLALGIAVLHGLFH